MNTDPESLVIVCGPTASGKTSTAIRLANEFRTEIISADSRQFYRQMKIGTAFPSEEELSSVPHHFLGHLDISESYNVSRYETDVLNLLPRLFQKHHLLIMTGGSGLYINAVCKGIDVLPDPDPELRKDLKHLLEEKGIESLQEKLRETDPEICLKIDLKNPVRLIRALEVSIISGIPYSSLIHRKKQDRGFRIIKTGLELPREELNKRIETRVDAMVEAGLVEEARQLFPWRNYNALRTVGYKELFEFFEGGCTLEEAVEKIKTNTRRYAKRQMTWFRRDHEIRWFKPEEIGEMIDYVLRPA